MRISSRTPEGEPNTCQICGKDFVLEPSDPPGDAPCPHCGSLSWFDVTDSAIHQPGFVRKSAYLAPAFRCTWARVECDFPDKPISQAARRAFRLGQLLGPIVRQWSRARRTLARKELTDLLIRCARCSDRPNLEFWIGPLMNVRVNGIEHDEYYETPCGDVVLRFSGDRLIVIFGMIPFSPLEWGAGIAPEQRWRQLTASSSALISALDSVSTTPP